VYNFSILMCSILNTKYEIRVMNTNLMNYLFSVDFVTQAVHVSGISVAHHQEVYCIHTTIGTCCAFYLTVCWPASDGRTVNKT